MFCTKEKKEEKTDQQHGHQDEKKNEIDLEWSQDAGVYQEGSEGCFFYFLVCKYILMTSLLVL